MIHLPTLLKRYQASGPDRGTYSQRNGHQEYFALLAAILAAYTASRTARETGKPKGLFEYKVYESYTENLLSTLTFARPHVQVAQALLIVALLKSSSFELHKAWMYCGTHLI